MRLLLLCILIVSCGVDVKVKPKAAFKVDPVKVGPDFEGAAKFCDERYGYKTVSSEACFIDYRDYFKLSVGVDTQGIANFCNESYTTEEDIQQCKSDLTDSIKNLGSTNEQV